jgi:hypothetical protein
LSASHSRDSAQENVTAVLLSRAKRGYKITQTFSLLLRSLSGDKIEEREDISSERSVRDAEDVESTGSTR